MSDSQRDWGKSKAAPAVYSIETVRAFAACLHPRRPPVSRTTWVAHSLVDANGQHKGRRTPTGAGRGLFRTVSTTPGSDPVRVLVATPCCSIRAFAAWLQGGKVHPRRERPGGPGSAPPPDAMGRRPPARVPGIQRRRGRPRARHRYLPGWKGKAVPDEMAPPPRRLLCFCLRVGVPGRQTAEAAPRARPRLLPRTTCRATPAALRGLP
jgi:hypothetical protein